MNLQNIDRFNVKKFIQAWIKNIFALIILLSPLAGYIGATIMAESMAPMEKAPYIHWNGLDPSHQVYVSWETEDAKTSYVKYGTDLSLSETPVSDSEVVTMHRIVLNGLMPGTKYYYKVGSSESDLMENTHSFSTAPNSYVPFNFTILSDTQQLWGTGHYDTLSSAIADPRHGDAAFVAYAGDMGQEPHDQNTWNFFMKHTAKFSNHIPIVPGNGNHDRDGHSVDTMYNKYFNISQYVPASSIPAKNYYAFNYSNILMLMCEIAEGGDCNPDSDFSIEQDTWINATLEATQSQDYRIMVFHRPMYSGAGYNWELINRFKPIIDKYNVSLVFYGHEHIYERYLVDNVTYVCLASGGGLQNVVAYQYPELRFQAMGASYTRLFITDTGILLKTYSPTFNIIDEYPLVKVGSKLIPQEVLD
jgi:hypothetical protein